MPVQTADTATLISAKWTLLEDSVYNDGNFFFSQGGTNYYPTPGVYLGTANDYYEFSSNGNLTVHENNLDFTSTYTIFPKSKLVITDLLVYDTAKIVTLNSSLAIFDWHATSSNSGKYYKRIYLKK